MMLGDEPALSKRVKVPDHLPDGPLCSSSRTYCAIWNAGAPVGVDMETA